MVINLETKLIEKSLSEYANAVDSPSGAPGGGSVASYVGSLAACLGKMYAYFSLEKKAFLALPEETQNQFKIANAKLIQVKNNLLKGVDQDALAYDMVLCAYKLAKDDPQREIRIQEALVLASDVPLDTLKNSVEGLDCLAIMIPLGNTKVVSDAAVAVTLFDSAIKSALLNLKINLNLLTDQKTLVKYQEAYEKYSALEQAYPKKLWEEAVSRI